MGNCCLVIPTSVARDLLFTTPYWPLRIREEEQGPGGSYGEESEGSQIPWE